MSTVDAILKKLSEEVDGDGDGTIFDGTERERPAPKKPEGIQPRNAPNQSAGVWRRRLRQREQELKDELSQPYKTNEARDRMAELNEKINEAYEMIEDHWNTHSEYDPDLAQEYHDDDTYLDIIRDLDQDLDLESKKQEFVEKYYEENLDEWTDYVEYAREYQEEHKEKIVDAALKDFGVTYDELESVIAESSNKWDCPYSMVDEESMNPDDMRTELLSIFDSSSGVNMKNAVEFWEEGLEDAVKETEEWQEHDAEIQERAYSDAELETEIHVDSDWRIYAGKTARGEMKKKVVEDVSLRLDKKLRNYDGLAKIGNEFPAADDPKSITQAVLDHWASSSSDKISVLVQEAVRQRFGDQFGTEEMITGSQPNRFLERAKRMLKDQDIADTMTALVESIYENTQERLKEAGITHLTLFRGMRWNPEGGVPDFAKRLKQQKGLFADGTHDWEFESGGKNRKGWKFATPPEQNPLASFSMHYGTAASFASSETGFDKALISAIVPVERIFCTFETGIGCMTEAEAVVIGGDGLNSNMIFTEGFQDGETVKYSALPRTAKDFHSSLRPATKLKEPEEEVAA